MASLKAGSSPTCEPTHIEESIRHLAEPLDGLTLDPANTRSHSDRNLKAIGASLNGFRQQTPIVVDQHDVVRKGNGTLIAARALGWDQIAVVRTTLTEGEARAYSIADNRTADPEIGSLWDDAKLAETLAALKDDAAFDHLLTGFDDKEIDQLVAQVRGQEVVEDEVPEVPADPVTRPGDLWELGEHRLLCGDSTKAEDVERVMAGERADCVFTSPPYAVGVAYGARYDDTIKNLRAMLPRLAALWNAVVSDGGFAVVNFGDVVSANAVVTTVEPCEYPMALEYWPVFRGAGWFLWSRRIWCKPGAATGSMQCINSNRAATNWEHIWTWKRPGVAVVSQQISGDCASQCGWFDSSHAHKLGVPLREHGAGMPVVVAYRSLVIHSRQGCIVHEPFCGTGTTMIAAEQLGRRCYAIEIEPKYVDVAVKRWMHLTQQEAIRESDGAQFSELGNAT